MGAGFTERKHHNFSCSIVNAFDVRACRIVVEEVFNPAQSSLINAFFILLWENLVRLGERGVLESCSGDGREALEVHSTTRGDGEGKHICGVLGLCERRSR